MKKWDIQYHERAKSSIEKLPVKILARYYALIDRMMELGPNLGEPHTKVMGDGLFELRIKAQEGIARVFYCVVVKKEIWMVHSFIKKDQKTPLKELKIAHNRLKEIKNEKR